MEKGESLFVDGQGLVVAEYFLQEDVFGSAQA